MRNSDRFTEKARKAIALAQDCAAELGHSYVGTEHLLLGIVAEGEGLGAKLLRDSGGEYRLIYELVERCVGRGAPGMPAQGLTPRAKRVIELAAQDAAGLGHSYVGTEHLLMGILREPESSAARLLASMGREANRLYTDILAVFGGPERGGRTPPATQNLRRRSGNTKTLDQYSRDLTEMAEKSQLDPVVGRDKEMLRVIQILSRPTLRCDAHMWI